jgi:hypothetical protein
VGEQQLLHAELSPVIYLDDLDTFFPRIQKKEGKNIQRYCAIGSIEME